LFGINITFMAFTICFLLYQFSDKIVMRFLGFTFITWLSYSSE
jgi:hypothetical protein